MTTVWITVAGLCVATAIIKGFGPLVFGGRDLPGILARAIPLLAPALLAALVITETVGGTGRSLVIDARFGGLIVAGFAIWRRWPTRRGGAVRGGDGRAAARRRIARGPAPSRAGERRCPHIPWKQRHPSHQRQRGLAPMRVGKRQA